MSEAMHSSWINYNHFYRSLKWMYHNTVWWLNFSMAYLLATCYMYMPWWSYFVGLQELIHVLQCTWIQISLSFNAQDWWLHACTWLWTVKQLLLLPLTHWEDDRLIWNLKQSCSHPVHEQIKDKTNERNEIVNHFFCKIVYTGTLLLRVYTSLPERTVR